MCIITLPSMKTKAFYYTGLLLLIICGCTSTSYKQQSISAEQTVQVDFNQTSNTLYISDITSSVQNISLKLPKEQFIGEAGQAFIDNSNIFILDRKQKKIFCFNDKGTLLYLLDKRGEGPEEYIDINHFWIRQDYIYIADNKSLKINIYTFDGQYVQTIKHGKISSDIVMDTDSTLLCFTSYYVHNNPNGLWKMNTEGKLTSNILNNETKYPILSMPWRNFYLHGDHSIGLFSPQENCFYTYRNDSLYADILLDIKQKTARSFPGIATCVDVQEGYFFPIWFIYGKRYLLSVWGYYDKPEAFYLLYSQTDNNLKIFKELSVNTNSTSSIGIPISSNLYNCLVTWTPDKNENSNESTLCIYHLKE